MSTWQNLFLENDMVTLKFSCGRSIIGFCGLGTGLGIPNARAQKWPSQPFTVVAVAFLSAAPNPAVATNRTSPPIRRTSQ